MTTEIRANPGHSRQYGTCIMILSDHLGLSPGQPVPARIESRHGVLDGEGNWSKAGAAVMLDVVRDLEADGYQLILPPRMAAALTAGLRVTVHLSDPPAVLKVLWEDVAIGGAVKLSGKGIGRTRTIQVDTAPADTVVAEEAVVAPSPVPSEGRMTPPAASGGKMLVLVGVGLVAVAAIAAALLLRSPPPAEEVAASPPPEPPLASLECSTVDMAVPLIPGPNLDSEWLLASLPGADWEAQLPAFDRFACASGDNRSRLRTLAERTLATSPGSDFAIAVSQRY